MANKEDSKSSFKFEKLNGKHPLQKVSKDFYVGYKARIRKGGKLFYFNFPLAKEMGLIASDFEEKITKDLEDNFLKELGLIIINEFDLEQGRTFPKGEVKDFEYMATRYLQMQHTDNVGKNSGDGRTIWNGCVQSKKKTWDVSSRGTGATCLSPATSKYGRFFESGDPTISYGCGFAEIDEAIGSVFFSEVFVANEVKTERVLGIIDYGNDVCITVRAYPNLLRPSHFFLHLRQNNYETLKNLVDYHIEREIKNQNYPKETKKKDRYSQLLKIFTHDFARIAAQFEDEYIFCWLDWDGDNILMDGGIIDYGSIRQFGLYHHEYRYDDVERYSTSLSEQKNKVKHMVQSFAQMIDYIETSEKKTHESFKDHWSLELFDEEFNRFKNLNFMRKLGLNDEQSKVVLKKRKNMIEEFRQCFSYFERAKSKEGLKKVADGVNWNAIFCMRDLLRVLPQIYLAREDFISNEEFIEIMASTYAQEEDLFINSYRSKKIKEFQSFYIELVRFLMKEEKKERNDIILAMSMNSSVINRYDRITGDSIGHIVHQILADKNKFSKKLHLAVEDFKNYQSNTQLTKKDSKVKYKNQKLMNKFMDIVVECREGL